MVEIRLKGSCVMTSVGQRVAAGVAEHVRMGLNASLAALPPRSIIRANPAGVNGAPRSEVNTNGDFGSCSRWSRRRDRNSSPRIGCVLGVPCLTLRTCMVAVRKSSDPVKVNQFGRTQAMPEDHQDHSRPGGRGD